MAAPKPTVYRTGTWKAGGKWELHMRFTDLGGGRYYDHYLKREVSKAYRDIEVHTGRDRLVWDTQSGTARYTGWVNEAGAYRSFTSDPHHPVPGTVGTSAERRAMGERLVDFFKQTYGEDYLQANMPDRLDPMSDFIQLRAADIISGTGYYKTWENYTAQATKHAQGQLAKVGRTPGTYTPPAQQPGGGATPPGTQPSGTQPPATTPGGGGAQQPGGPLDTSGEQGPTPPGGGIPTGPTQDQRDAFAILRDVLNRYDLGSLTDWLWSQIVEDVPEAEIFIRLRDTDAYRLRFPGMEARRQGGLRVLSEEEYIRNEEEYRRVLRSLGADPKSYDQPGDFLKYFQGDLAPREIEDRGQLWRTLTQNPAMNARIKGLFRVHAGIPQASDEDLYRVLVGADQKTLERLSTAPWEGGQHFNPEQWRTFLTQALRQEEATFQGGGGQITQSQAGRPGLLGARTEQYT